MQVATNGISPISFPVLFIGLSSRIGIETSCSSYLRLSITIIFFICDKRIGFARYILHDFFDDILSISVWCFGIRASWVGFYYSLVLLETFLSIDRSVSLTGAEIQSKHIDTSMLQPPDVIKILRKEDRNRLIPSYATLSCFPLRPLL